MKRTSCYGTLAFLLVFGWVGQSVAQESPKESATAAEAKSPENKPAPENQAAKEESSVTEHSIRIGGQTIPYKASASTTLLKNEKGEPTALMYSTAYTRSDVKDFSQRPIAFLYNGGPGSASVWLHMGAFGPRRVVTENAAATPPAPYKIVDNEYSLLDISGESSRTSNLSRNSSISTSAAIIVGIRRNS
jgi:carboxypeptidase C (cathepsin A)